PFELSLVRSIVPGPDMILLLKEADRYLYILETETQLQLTFHDKHVEEKLEKILQHKKEKQQGYTEGIYNNIKWKSIRATVTHVHENFGKAYLVSHIEFAE